MTMAQWGILIYKLSAQIPLQMANFIRLLFVLIFLLRQFKSYFKPRLPLSIFPSIANGT